MALNILANGNIGLQSDQVTFIHLSAFNVSGAMVPTPVGDVDTVAATGTFAASLAFSMDVMPAGSSDPGDPAVKCVPLVQKSDASNNGGNIGLIITDSKGLTQTLTKNFDIVLDLVLAVKIGLDETNSATQSQPLPVATGP